jgi:uncharacterized membrane protein
LGVSATQKAAVVARSRPASSACAEQHHGDEQRSRGSFVFQLALRLGVLRRSLPKNAAISAQLSRERARPFGSRLARLRSRNWPFSPEMPLPFATPLLYSRAMATGNADDVLFSATLTPHRSLSRRGFLLLMGDHRRALVLHRPVFLVSGAALVMGFFGLDFLAVWIAFKLNYRAARAYEDIEVSRDALVIRKVSAGGRVQEIRFNPLGAPRTAARGGRRHHPVAVRMRGERVPVGAFLNPEDRQSFARAFGAALAEARR